MKTSKGERILSTVPVLSWWLSDKLDALRRRSRAKNGVDAIDNLQRLHRLKERGAITEEDFQELKEKLKKQI